MPPPYVCVQCNKEMICFKTGAKVLETFNAGVPYQLWDADVFECPICKCKVVVGFGRNPLSEHWHSDFQQKLEKHKPTIKF